MIDSPLVNKFHITIVGACVGGIDLLHDRLPPCMGIVEIDRYGFAYLPVRTDVGDGSEG